MTQLQAAFDLLGVSPDSDPATVKKAWHVLVRSYHPDMANTDPQAANRRLAEINAAYDAVCASTKADRNHLRSASASPETDLNRRTAARTGAATDRERRRAEATERARQRAEAAERARLAALGIREMAQQRAARAAFTEPGAKPSKTGKHPDSAARRGAVDAGRETAGSRRSADPSASRDRAAAWNLAKRAAATLKAFRTVCSRERKAGARTVSI